MVDENGTITEPTAGLSATPEGEPSGSVSDGEPSVQEGGASGSQETIRMIRDLSRRLETAERLAQSARDIQRNREEREGVAGSSQPTGPSQLDLVANQLRAAGWNDQQIASVISPAQAQYQGQATQAQLQEYQAQMTALQRQQFINQRALKAGVDPTDSRLDLTSEAALERSIADIRVEAAKKEVVASYEDRLKVLEEKDKAREVQVQQQLEQHGILDNPTGDHTGALGDRTAEVTRLNQQFNQGHLTREEFEKRLAALG